MKKFLFTLAALLMTSTAFAESYLYIDAEDVVVTADDIANGTELEIPVRASFAARVSGWDFEITNLPAGITFTFAEKGADFDVTTKNARGRDQVVSATLYGAEEPYLHMLAVQGEVGYWQDPNGENPNAWVSYGVAKWEGGDYAEMLLMYAVFDENYHGGVIETLTSVASGNDTRGGTVQEQGDHAKYFTHDGGMMEDPNPVTEEPADAPVIEFAEDGSGVMITIENYTECSIKVDGVEVATEAPYYVEKIYDAAQAIVVYAKNAPEGFTPAEDTKTYDLPEKQKEQTSKPSVTYSYDNGELTVWAYGCTEENVEYTLYCDGVEYTGEMPIAYDIYEGYNHVWTATALAPNCLVSEMSDECPIVIDAVVPEYQTPDPVITITDDAEAQVVTITVTGEGNLTIKVTKMNDDPEMTGEVVYENAGVEPLTYEIPYGDAEAYYSVYATATADMPGYDVIPADATEPFVVVPAKPAVVEQTDAPVISWNYVQNGVEVTATGNGHICLYVEDMLVAEGEGVATYVIESSELEEEYGVSATAQEDGKLVSEYAVETVYVPGMVVEEKTDAPVISWNYVENGVEVTATGNGHICLYVEDILVAEGEGVATYVIESTEMEEEYGVSATAEEIGKLVSDYAVETVYVPGIVVEEQTEKPVITYTEVENGVEVTATGNGHICLYVNDILVAEGEGVATYVIESTEMEEEYGVSATAEENGKLVSEYAVETVYVPAATVTPEDPHMQGWWIMLLDKNNNEIWYPIWEGSDGSYTTTVTLDYETYGEFFLDPNDPTTEANRPAVPFYFVVDGEIWGSTEAYQATAMGESANTVSNPLFNGENGYYTVPVGYSYTLGIFVDKTGLRPDTDKYVYCAQGLATGVNELNGEKAVAGVRYFNLAGQEMQEANGMTIVVTTYTDGTTSAVKVMK